ncbi:hypothetical protein M9H77_07092 [Catharanthus roseus]|uniref:Uncharacterized protein n=1 Tax=Catharanthus roseus TaxID=4058 RepID=A0ACC0BU70_CATRO|nr:hypothetical protein M9H77_07092 [Catharanthus roseus]
MKNRVGFRPESSTEEKIKEIERGINRGDALGMMELGCRLRVTGVGSRSVILQRHSARENTAVQMVEFVQSQTSNTVILHGCLLFILHKLMEFLF